MVRPELDSTGTSEIEYVTTRTTWPRLAEPTQIVQAARSAAFLSNEDVGKIRRFLGTGGKEARDPRVTAAVGDIGRH